MVSSGKSSESKQPQTKRNWGKMIKMGGGSVVAVVVVMALTVVALHYFLGSHKQVATTTAQDQTSQNAPTPTSTDQLQLDATKNYGDKYKNGILPVGDKKYSAFAAKQGYIYACSQYAQNLESGTGGGASTRGPWLNADGTTYDINKKAHVSGSVTWTPKFSDTVNGTTRTIVSNNLPNHPTGVFPIQSGDPAYADDHNPNSIASQNFTYALAASPTYGGPNCMGGQVGVMLTGVALFSAFDAEGRDAGAWEVQDDCSGHPEKTGEYHYHTLSSCIKDTSVQTVIGFALDGFPITGPKVGEGNVLTTSDLDECHGITSQINLDGKPVTTYHYVMTQDFPYSVSCFRGEAIQPPGLQQAAQPSAPAGKQPARR